jgi:hypothetical protein
MQTFVYKYWGFVLLPISGVNKVSQDSEWWTHWTGSFPNRLNIKIFLVHSDSISFLLQQAEFWISLRRSGSASGCGWVVYTPLVATYFTIRFWKPVDHKRQKNPATDNLKCLICHSRRHNRCFCGFTSYSEYRYNWLIHKTATRQAIT